MVVNLGKPGKTERIGGVAFGVLPEGKRPKRGAMKEIPIVMELYFSKSNVAMAVTTLRYTLLSRDTLNN